MNSRVFFDSYALIEVARGSQAYSPFSSVSPVFTKLNLFEVYYALLRENAFDSAGKVLSKLYPLTVDFDASDITRAAQMRIHYAGRRLSMTDCIGYVVSQRLGLPFLTGDNEFRDIAGVQFVK